MYLARDGVTRLGPVARGRRSVPARHRSDRRGRPARARCSSSFRRASTPSRTRAATSTGCSAGFAAYPLAVELRHRSWSDEAGRDARAARRARRRVGADRRAEVPSRRSGSPLRATASTPATRRLTYVRLHGRNAAAWWEHDEAEDRYNYLYSADELRPFADAAQTRRAASKRVLIYFNNHFSAKAVANAAVLRARARRQLAARATIRARDGRALSGAARAS